MQKFSKIDTSLSEVSRLLDEGKSAQAIILLEQLLIKNPKNPNYLFKLAISYAEQSNYLKAFEIFRKLESVLPNSDWVKVNIAVTLMKIGDMLQAEIKLKEALILNPNNKDTIFNLIILLNSQEKYQDSIKLINNLILQDQSNPKIYSLLGGCLAKLNDMSAARISYEIALEIDKDFIEAKFNLANIELLSGNYFESIFLYESILNTERMISVNDIQIEPIRFSMAMAYLSVGNLEKGWENYEYGFHTNVPVESRRSPNRTFKVPKWSGENHTSKTLLIWGEQGIGDEILFMSCLNDLNLCNMRIIVECQERLVRSLQRSFPKFIVRPSAYFNTATLPAVFDDFDYHIPAGSLMKIFRPTINKFQESKPYILVDEFLAAKYEELLQNKSKNKKRIGICWRSSKLNPDRNHHYTNLSDWINILSTPNCDFINLQYGECESEIVEFENKNGLEIIRWNDLDLKNDFESTFALMSRLDIVITVGTAVSQMSAAIGLPVILMQPYTWASLGTDYYPFFENIIPIFPNKGEDVTACLDPAHKLLIKLIT